jgi:hypothetical protein
MIALVIISLVVLLFGLFCFNWGRKHERQSWPADNQRLYEQVIKLKISNNTLRNDLSVERDHVDMLREANSQLESEKQEVISRYQDKAQLKISKEVNKGFSIGPDGRIIDYNSNSFRRQ